MDVLNHAINVANDAEKWLLNQKTDCKILIKQTRNLGDTLHITPIAKHYKIKYPKCKIAFMVGDKYSNVHKFNENFDKIFEINANLNPQQRIKLGDHMKNIKSLDHVIIPSIFPFGEVWTSNKWSYPIIALQYFANAGISPPESILGGGKLSAPVSKDDMDFADKFIGNNKKIVGLEYNSYSKAPVWGIRHFQKLVILSKTIGYSCISFASKNEVDIPGTIDGRGLDWRKTIAVLSKCEFLIGVGSGITMLACCANPQPHIIEIGIPPSVQVKSCGYTNNSVSMFNVSPLDVYRYMGKMV